MKRIVHLFLLALMIVSSVATAEAKSKRTAGADILKR